ncbi:hypothetical protein [Sphingobacterium sp. FBM7-1]|uniref:hypothetical protein n=1 Tax=Sphingobacterium sp. FBM7-1 TaxID=2886688 RepID=UPI001D125322|nr:hypothetical protein [Sphingobacterium sp. FBM7-1]MCC2600563.1 hypothetical protein [Sphingobacterium sp. FBM7-1]
MKNKTNTAGEQQAYPSENTPEMINLPEPPEMKTEANVDDTTPDEERYSEIEDSTLSDTDIAEQARRLAVNYIRSLRIF